MKWILPALILLAPHAHAQKYAPTSFDQMPALLSYEQLMYLPAAKRIEYIKDIRNVLTDLETDLRNSNNPQATAENLRKLFMPLLYTFLYPDAHAAPAVPAPGLTNCPSGFTNLSAAGGCAKVSRGTCASNERLKTVGNDKYCLPANARSSRGGVAAPTGSPSTPSGGGTPPRPASGAGAVGAGSAAPAALPGDRSGDISAQRRDYSGPADGSQNLPGECKLRTTAANFHADTSKFFRETNVGDKIRNCIMGGMFSEYNNGEIKVANCKKVQTFPPDSTAAGADKLSCSGKKSMCNPLLYCGPKKGEAHCLPVSQEMTASCNAKAKADCDPFTGETAVPGAKDEWTEFKKNFDRTCKGGRGGSRFVEYFCKECKKLEERMKVIEEKYKAYTKSMPSPAAPRPGSAPPAGAPAGGDGQGLREPVNI